MMNTIFKNCELITIGKEYWSNFAPLHCTELSDFQEWAMLQAFEKIGLKSTKGDNCWYWIDGILHQDIYNNKRNHTNTLKLHITAEGALILREYDVTSEDFTQVAQYRIKMNLV